jgi:hypothetical protein
MAKVTRNDGFANALTGMGTRKDPTQYNEIANRLIRLTREECSALYEQNGSMRKLCEMFPQAATAQGGEATFGGKSVPKELPEKIASKIEMLQVGERLRSKHGKNSKGLMAALRSAQTKANIFGNAAIVVFVDDGDTPLDQPVNWKKLKSVDELFVLDRWDIYPDTTNTAELQQIDKYILVRGQIDTKMTTHIHSDRVLWFSGDENTVWSRMINNGCDSSKFVAVLDAWQAYKTGLQGIARMIIDASQRKHGIKGLLDNLDKNGEEYEQFIQKRLQVNDLSNSIWQTFVYDLDEEDISFLERSAFGGVKDAIETIKSEFVANTDLTSSQLFGDFVGGILTAGSETERDQVNLAVSNKQADMTSLVIALLEMILRSKEFGNIDPLEVQLRWKWNSYLQPSPIEQSELELNRLSAAATANQINPNVAGAMLLSYYRGAQFNPVVNLPPELIKSLEDAIKEASKPPVAEEDQAEPQMESPDEV